MVHTQGSARVMSVLLVIAALLAGALGNPTSPTTHTFASTATSTTTSTVAEVAGAAALDTGLARAVGAGRGLDVLDAPELVEKIAPSLVNIDAGHLDGSGSSGTGIVLSRDGLVLTNYHVIAEASTLRVTELGHGRAYRAEVIGADRDRDIAVIGLRHASGLRVARFGDSDEVEIGDLVASIGNAHGLGGLPSVGTGPVTGLRQSIGSTTGAGPDAAALRGLIRARSNIQPGESGGAMVNADGEVIGMNVAYSSDCDGCGPNGAGYAIPINQALRVARQLAGGED